MRKLFFVTFVIALLSACTISSGADTTRTAEMNRLEIALRRLGATVQSLLWSGAQPDADLLAMACANDRTLCSPFGNNRLHIKVVEGNAVLLLCTPDDRRALVEDIACTPTPDYKAWTDGNQPCEFTLPEQTIHGACR
ncbi:MAG: hypothetical protein LBH14_02460 [Desulfobulbaceae bacterium]|jgi:hypothetical protein|nr:hypothetical protein [Desulfobulbaceae bacterium]